MTSSYSVAKLGNLSQNLGNFVATWDFLGFFFTKCLWRFKKDLGNFGGILGCFGRETWQKDSIVVSKPQISRVLSEK